MWCGAHWAAASSNLPSISPAFLASVVYSKGHCQTCLAFQDEACGVETELINKASLFPLSHPYHLPENSESGWQNIALSGSCLHGNKEKCETVKAQVLYIPRNITAPSLAPASMMLLSWEQHGQARCLSRSVFIWLGNGQSDGRVSRAAQLLFLASLWNIKVFCLDYELQMSRAFLLAYWTCNWKLCDVL